MPDSSAHSHLRVKLLPLADASLLFIVKDSSDIITQNWPQQLREHVGMTVNFEVNPELFVSCPAVECKGFLACCERQLAKFTINFKPRGIFKCHAQETDLYFEMVKVKVSFNTKPFDLTYSASIGSQSY